MADDGQKPFTDPTQLTPAQWQEYLTNARQALHANPKDREALAAIDQANQALSAYDQADAATPGERISAGVKGGLSGLGQAALDIPRGLLQTVLHPIKTVESLPQIPGAIARGISSDDPEQVARTVGNIGSALLPFAKTSNKAGAPAVGAVVSQAIKSGVGRVTAPARFAAEIPGLTNEWLKLRNAKARMDLLNANDTPSAAARVNQVVKGGAGIDLPDTPPEELPDDIRQAVADHAAGKISAEDLNTAMDFARGRPLRGGSAKPISEGPPGSNKPITPQPGIRGPGGSQRWSTTQVGQPEMDLNSPASEAQLKMLKQMSPAQLREALKNPFFAQLAKALGVQ